MYPTPRQQWRVMWSAFRRARRKAAYGDHMHVVAVRTSFKLVRLQAVTAGFALRHAWKLVTAAQMAAVTGQTYIWRSVPELPLHEAAA